MQSSDKHAAVEQEGDAMQSSKPCTKHDSTSAKHSRAHSRAASPLKRDHCTKADNQERHTISGTCDAGRYYTWGRGASRNCNATFQTIDISKHNLEHAYFCTLTCCKPMEGDHWAKAERVEAIHLVSYMSCNPATNMRPWKKKTLQNQVTNHAQSMSRPRTCTRKNTHGLQAH